MTDSTPEQVGASDPATPPEPDKTEGEARTPEQADSPEQADESEVPNTEELEEPSTEKAADEQPKAPGGDEREPDHEAVGIGVEGRPLVDPDDKADPDGGS